MRLLTRQDEIAILVIATYICACTCMSYAQVPRTLVPLNEYTYFIVLLAGKNDESMNEARPLRSSVRSSLAQKEKNILKSKDVDRC